MARVIKCIVNILFIIVIIALAGYFVLMITDKVEIYNVKTGSMENKIHVGDYILIFKMDDYHIGDVVTFRQDGGYITHRIIKKIDDKVITKGDANNMEDEEISSSNIVGKVILSGGILNYIINYRYAFVGVLLSLYLVSRYLDNLKKDNLEKNDSNSVLNVEEVKNDKEENNDAIDEKTEIKDENDNKTEISNSNDDKIKSNDANNNEVENNNVSDNKVEINDMNDDKTEIGNSSDDKESDNKVE